MKRSSGRQKYKLAYYIRTISFTRARSATTASSTGKPGKVTRRRPSDVVSTKPCSCSVAIRTGSSARPENAVIARDVDAFGKPQPHEQKLVGHFLARQHVIGDEAVAVGLDPHQPGLRPFFRRGGVPVAADIEPAMGARSDAGIFVAAPIDEIVPAFAAGPRVVGNLVGRQAVRGADVLGGVVERARRDRRREFSACRPHGARRMACPARWSADRATDARRPRRARA